MQTIRAIYENRVFRPIEHVDLPEHCLVEFEPRYIKDELALESLNEVYALLSERYDSRETDVAARHDDPQP